MAKLNNKEDITRMVNEIIGKINGVLPVDVELQWKQQLSQYQLLEFGLLIKEQLQNISKGDSKENLAKEFLELAKQDIEATKILYEKGIYNLSVYHLQQAVEKVTKAFGLASFILTKKDIRKMGHKTPRAFVKLLKRKWIPTYLRLTKMLWPNLKGNIQELEDKINNVVNKKQLELARINKQEIEVALCLFEKTRSNLNNNQMEEKISKMEKQIGELMDVLIEYFPPLNHDKRIQMLKTNFDIALVIELAVEFANLWLLSLMTYPHFSFTRYPDGRMDPREYTRGLGVVDMSLEICKSLEPAIASLEKYLFIEDTSSAKRLSGKTLKSVR